MRNLLIFMFLVAVFVLGSRSCNFGNVSFGDGIKGEGPVQTETRTATDFHAIELNISGNVDVTIGENYSVEVSAQQNLLPLLKTEVKDGTLRIFCNENMNSSEDIKIRVTAPAFDQFSLAGSGEIRVPNALRAEKMELNISGSGDVFCPQSDFGVLNISIVGSGDIELGGKANDMKADISGSGEIRAKGLTTNTLKVNITGSGTVTADVSMDLVANISGSGDVFYSGSPKVESNVIGSGSVEKLEAQ
ncbi:MAG: DUF2807 domain-containing protein [Lewinellaceae bacterium]|nr:DUF2807 domain-containing protein [Lewinellaceae bacterium]